MTGLCSISKSTFLETHRLSVGGDRIPPRTIRIYFSYREVDARGKKKKYYYVCHFPIKFKYGFYSSWPRVGFDPGFSESLKITEV